MSDSAQRPPSSEENSTTRKDLHHEDAHHAGDTSLPWRERMSVAAHAVTERIHGRPHHDQDGAVDRDLRLQQAQGYVPEPLQPFSFQPKGGHVFGGPKT